MVANKALRFITPGSQFFFRDDHTTILVAAVLYLRTGKDYSSLRDVQHLTFVAVVLGDYLYRGRCRLVGKGTKCSGAENLASSTIRFSFY